MQWPNRRKHETQPGLFSSNISKGATEFVSEKPNSLPDSISLSGAVTHIQSAHSAGELRVFG